MNIPQEAKDVIDFVIENDEGGWKLTHNPNDPDGGWTYAGITARTYNEHEGRRVGAYREDEDWLDYESIKKYIDDDANRLHDAVYEIYYTKYYLALQGKVMPAELSCAVNCGVETTTTLIATALTNKTDTAYLQLFLHQWLLHYAELVQHNAEAWRDYAKFLKSQIELGEKTTLTKVEEPKTLRAEFLAGWINRVEKYR